MKAAAGGDVAQVILGEFLKIEDNLDVLDGSTVVECNKLYVLVATAGAYPTHHAHLASNELRREYINYFCTFHLSENVIMLASFE